MKHATLSPSHADTWMTCAAALRVSKDSPDTDTIYAREGNFMHELAAYALDNECAAVEAFKMQHGISEKPEDAPELNDEQREYDLIGGIEAVQIYLDHVRGLGCDNYFVEVELDFTSYLAGIEVYLDDVEGRQFGNGDFVGFNLDTQTLHVCDYKNGVGVIVDAKDNRQAKIYALGALAEYGFIFEIKNIQMHIIQPRAIEGAPIKSFALSIDDLEQWATDELAPAAERAIGVLHLPEPWFELAPEAFNPTPKGCQWCRGKDNCPALHEITASTALEGFEPIGDGPNARDVTKLTLDQIGQMLPWKKTVIDFFTALEDRAYREDELGRSVPGFKRVLGNKGNRAWTDPKAATKTLKRLLKEENRKQTEAMAKPKPVTPTQAEKLLGKTIYEAELAPLIEQSPAKPTLVPVSDRRVAIASNVTEGFENLENQET